MRQKDSSEKHFYSDRRIIVTGASSEILTRVFLSALSSLLILAGSQLWTPLLGVGGGERPGGGDRARAERGARGVGALVPVWGGSRQRG